jgi:hypothetical protein
LSEQALKTGENLIQVAFEHITDEQIQKLNINTKIQRMDSTQILSNIADLSRLELLVGVLQRLHRILSEADQTQYWVFDLHQRHLTIPDGKRRFGNTFNSG